MISMSFHNKMSAPLPIKSTNTLSQVEYLYSILSKGSYNTLELQKLGIFSPAPRIYDLKKYLAKINSNLSVEKVFVTVTDDTGLEHQEVALYSLVIKQPIANIPFQYELFTGGFLN